MKAQPIPEKNWQWSCFFKVNPIRDFILKTCPSDVMDSHRKIFSQSSGSIPAVKSVIDLLRLHGHALVFFLIAILASFSSPQIGLARLSEGTWRGIFFGKWNRNLLPLYPCRRWDNSCFEL
jgi:hypothetical protein